MLKPIKKLRRTFDNGMGIFYYCGTNQRAPRPLSLDDILDSLDQMLARINELSKLENIKIRNNMAQRVRKQIALSKQRRRRKEK